MSDDPDVNSTDDALQLLSTSMIERGLDGRAGRAAMLDRWTTTLAGGDHSLVDRLVRQSRAGRARYGDVGDDD